MQRPFLVKTLLVGALALVLMIPVGMIRDLVAERQARHDAAVAGIAEGWGKRQTVASPYLVLPYERHWTEVKRETIDGKVRETRTERSELGAHRYQARDVRWNVSAKLSEKYRGIYKARLYGAAIDVQGAVALPPRAALEDGTSRYKWHNPKLVVGISDPVGIRWVRDAAVGGKAYTFAPGSGDSSMQAGVHAPLEGWQKSKEAETLEFDVALELGGSEALSIAPLGADTTVAMRADWRHPSFQGRFLPASHEITPAGFSAEWKISKLAGVAANCPWPCLTQQVAVSFVEPAGLYQRLERASKYGFLFLGLTFAAFMLFEVMRRLAIHPVQYALVGLALAMFFLLLTSLSEHIAFYAAYAIATAACVGLITAYLVYVLRDRAVGLAFGAALAGLYAVLYALLRSEDHALLGGSLLLFGLLAALMLATRRVDWYAVTQSNSKGSANA